MDFVRWNDMHQSVTPLTLLIVWHSRTGAARQLAEAASAAARQQADREPVTQASCRPVRVDLRQAEDTDPEHLLAASAYLFVMPENLASMSGAMKEFFDRTYYAVIEHLAGRPYGLIVAAGTDGRGAVRQAERIVTGWRLRTVAAPLIVNTGAQTPAAILAPKVVDPAALAQASELGAALAEGLAMGIF